MYWYRACIISCYKLIPRISILYKTQDNTQFPLGSVLALQDSSDTDPMVKPLCSAAKSTLFAKQSGHALFSPAKKQKRSGFAAKKRLCPFFGCPKAKAQHKLHAFASKKCKRSGTAIKTALMRFFDRFCTFALFLPDFTRKGPGRLSLRFASKQKAALCAAFKAHSSVKKKAATLKSGSTSGNVLPKSAAEQQENRCAFP